MKKSSILAAAILLIGIVIAVGSVSFLGPCVHEDGSFGACHWAGRAMLGIGVLMGLESIYALMSRDGAARSSALACMFLTALLGALTPGTLIDLCHMATMRCRAVMRPAMMILCSLAALISLIGCLTGLRKTGEKK